MEDLKKVQELPEFKKASSCIKEKKYEEAVDIFGSLLGQQVENYGDLGFALGPLYYAYGSACLLQVESSANVFGDMVKHQKEIDEEMKQKEEEESKVEDNTAKDQSAGDMIDTVLEGLIEEYTKKNGKEPTEDVIKQWKETFASAASDMPGLMQSNEPEKKQDIVEEKVNDIEEKQPKETQPTELTAADIDELMGVAWECLETSRVVFSKFIDKTDKPDASDKDKVDVRETKILLAKSLLRLGDHSMEIGRFDQSIEDYKKCLEIRESIFDDSCRELPDVYSSIAYALLYASTEEKDRTKAVSMRLSTLEYYSKAMECLLIIRQDRLKVPRKVFGEKLLTSKIKLTEKAETSDKGKSKADPEKELTLSEPQASFAKQVKSRLDLILKHVENEGIDKLPEDLTPDEKEKRANEAKELGEVIQELGNKVIDILQVLENPEAAKAISGAEVVEEALANAAGAKEGEGSSSSFDKPTLASNEPVQTLGIKRKPKESDADESNQKKAKT